MNPQTSPIEPTPPPREGDQVTVVVSTVKGSDRKYVLADSGAEFYDVIGVLPPPDAADRRLGRRGSRFPYDFGAIPETLGKGCDQLDVLLLTEERTKMAAHIPARLIGAFEAELRNRAGEVIGSELTVVAVATVSAAYSHFTSLATIDVPLLEEIERFFTSYHASNGRKIAVLARVGTDGATRLLEEGRQRYIQRLSQETATTFEKRVSVECCSCGLTIAHFSDRNALPKELACAQCEEFGSYRASEGDNFVFKAADCRSVEFYRALGSRTGAVFPYRFRFMLNADGQSGVVVLDAVQRYFIDSPQRGECIGFIDAEEIAVDGSTEKIRQPVVLGTRLDTHRRLKSWDELAEDITKTVEEFFVWYSQSTGKTVKPSGWSAPDRPAAAAGAQMEGLQQSAAADTSAPLPVALPPRAAPAESASTSDNEAVAADAPVAPWLVFVVQYLLPVGRIGRGEFILRAGALFLTLWGGALWIKGIGLDEDSAAYTMAVMPIVAIFALVAVQSGKRLHDFDASAWWILFMATGLGAFFMALLLTFRRGTAGPNRFGDRAPTSDKMKTAAWLVGTVVLVLACTHVGLAFLSDSEPSKSPADSPPTSATPNR